MEPVDDRENRAVPIIDFVDTGSLALLQSWKMRQDVSRATIC
jgi:hypothetical protein